MWLFFVQHQFEHTVWSEGGDWSFSRAALYGSSHYDLPAVLRWFTANIGMHHIHHLCSRIPFYRLPMALRDHPGLGSLWLRVLRACAWCSGTRRHAGSFLFGKCKRSAPTPRPRSSSRRVTNEGETQNSRSGSKSRASRVRNVEQCQYRILAFTARIPARQSYLICLARCSVTKTFPLSCSGGRRRRNRGDGRFIVWAERARLNSQRFSSKR